MKAEDFTQQLIKNLLPRHMRRRVMHWHKFRQADYILVSYPKCGRTWLRVMLSHYYVERYGLAEGSLLDFANLHYQNPAVPKIFLSNDVLNEVLHRTRSPEIIDNDKSAYYHRNVIYLARDPRDVVVSMYFQRSKRDSNYRGSLLEFINDEVDGLNTIIRFYNAWAAALPKIDRSLLIKYEDMRADPGATLGRFLEFTGHTPDPVMVQNAVEASSFERMKKMERNNQFERSWLKAGDVKDEESFKVRRGKIGGYTDYLEEDGIASVNRLINERLAPDFGYQSP
jgi:hypothetical protein